LVTKITTGSIRGGEGEKPNEKEVGGGLGNCLYHRSSHHGVWGSLVYTSLQGKTVVLSSTQINIWLLPDQWGGKKRSTCSRGEEGANPICGISEDYRAKQKVKKKLKRNGIEQKKRGIRKIIYK